MPKGIYDRAKAAKPLHRPAKLSVSKLPEDKDIIFGKSVAAFKLTDIFLLEVFDMSMKKMPVSSIGYVLGYNPHGFQMLCEQYPEVEYALTAGRAWGDKVVAGVLWTMLKEKNAPIVSLFAKACLGMGSPEELLKLLPERKNVVKVTDIDFRRLDAQEASRVYQDLMREGSKK